MRIINCEQGSDKWLQARLGKATASEFSKVVTSKGVLSKSIDVYSAKLAAEKITGIQEDTYTSYDMQRGSDLEDDALAFYEQETLSKVDIVGFCDENDYGCSPDGLVGEDGVVEVKCLNQVNHLEHLNSDKVGSKYFHQIQGNLMVTGRKWLDFILYNPDYPENMRLKIFRFERDEAFISRLKEGIDLLINKRDEIVKSLEDKYGEIK